MEETMAKLTEYALSATVTARAMCPDDPRERAEILAISVGRQSQRLGMTPKEFAKWLQAAYGRVWVKEFNLNPGADLKEILRWATEARNPAPSGA